MTRFSRIGLDTSKAVFTLHRVDRNDLPLSRLNLRRARLLPFFREHPATVVALEACGGSHHRACELTALGHEVRLIPAQYVKPYLKRGKNDRDDEAEAISMNRSPVQRDCFGPFGPRNDMGPTGLRANRRRPRRPVRRSRWLRS